MYWGDGVGDAVLGEGVYYFSGETRRAETGDGQGVRCVQPSCVAMLRRALRL